jgi:F-type H+-transporting ATPase subunit gamma
MSQLLTLRQRLKSTKSLNSILSAMQIIAVTKLQKARQQHRNAKFFSEELIKMQEYGGDYEPLPRKRSVRPANLVILISSNQGLCGGFNTNLFKVFRQFLDKLDGPVEILAFGKKAQEYLSREKRKAERSYLDSQPNAKTALEISKNIEKLIDTSSIKSVYVVSNQFETMLSQKPKVYKLWPITLEKRKPRAVLFDPNKELIFNAYLSSYLYSQIFLYWAESWLGELSARILALKNAVDNSEELIKTLVVSVNKIRQSNITRELAEVTGAFEALKEEE